MLLPDSAVQEILGLIERHNPSSMDKNIDIVIKRCFSARIYWALGDRKHAVSISWGSSATVYVEIKELEGTPAELLAAGNLLVRITALAESIQAILDAH